MSDNLEVHLIVSTNYLNEVWLLSLSGKYDIIVRVNAVLGQSFNQLNFCPSATWDPEATTFADNNTLGTHAVTVFVDTNNTVFATAQTLNRILIWFEGQTAPPSTISGTLN